MLKPFPRSQLRKILRKTVLLSKKTITLQNDSYEQAETASAGPYTINAEIQELTSDDLRFMPPGVLSVGDAYGYFQPKYYWRGKPLEVNVEDEVSWDNKTWIVDRIERFFFGKDVCYLRALLRRKV